MAQESDLQALSHKWAESLFGDNPVSWTGRVNGINFDVASPTHDSETVGQTICRLGDDLYREAQQPRTVDANLATINEARDFLDKLPGAQEWFNVAINSGFGQMMQSDDAVTALLGDLTNPPDTLASHPVGDVNPRYAQYITATKTPEGVDTDGILNGPGDAQPGRVTSVDYGDPDPVDDED